MRPPLQTITNKRHCSSVGAKPVLACFDDVNVYHGPTATISERTLVGCATVQALPTHAKYHQYHGRELVDGEVVIMSLKVTNQSLQNEQLEVRQTKPSGIDAVYGFNELADYLLLWDVTKVEKKVSTST